MQYLNYWLLLAGLVIILILIIKRSSREWLKNKYINFKRHKILYFLVLLLGVFSVWMFNRSFYLQWPVASKNQAVAELMGLTKENETDVWNDRAMCMQELENLKNTLYESETDK